MAHTPGPWRWTIGSDGWDGKSCSLVGADDKLIICGWGYDACGIVFGRDEHHTVEDEPNLPDARLIAAAPDLLYALKYLLELGGDDDRRICAEQAIAKAEGIAP